MDIPGINIGLQTDYKRLYYSDPEAALKIPITISPGFGVLKLGTTLALNNSAAGNDGKFFPYDPTVVGITGAEPALSRSYLVQDQSTGTAVCYVTLADSYRFIVGDDIIIIDSDGEGALDNGGAITAIDRSTYPHMAKITFTTNTGDTFTTAKFAFAIPEGFNTAIGILEKSVDTGVGATAKGAGAVMIVGNAVLYTGMLENLDSNGITDLSTSAIGQYTILP